MRSRALEATDVKPVDCWKARLKKETPMEAASCHRPVLGSGKRTSARCYAHSAMIALTAPGASCWTQ
jgi:hypothetical protein